MNHNLSICAYPNNEIRATLYRVRSASPPRGSSGSVWDAGHGEEPTPSGDRPVRESVRSLDNRSELSVTPPPGYGGSPRPTKFGLNGRRTIARCAGVFDHDGIDNSELLFLTGTIPGSTKAAYDAVAQWSSWVVKAVKTWIGSQGCDGAFSMYCWEFQKRGALHLHYCLWVSDPVARLRILWRWAARWAAVIDSVSSRSGVDCWERSGGGSWRDRRGIIQAAAQYVRRSVGSYLSKYLSKDAAAIADKVGRKFLGPVRWWGCSRPLLARCRALTSSALLEAIDVRAYRHVWNHVCEVFGGAADGYHEYCDRLGFARVCVAYDDDAGQLFNILWRDLWLNRNRGRAGSNSLACPTLLNSVATATSGTTSTVPPSVSTRRFAVKVRARACLSSIAGWRAVRFRMPSLNIGLRKNPRRPNRQISIWISKSSLGLKGCPARNRIGYPFVV